MDALNNFEPRKSQQNHVNLQLEIPNAFPMVQLKMEKEPNESQDVNAMESSSSVMNIEENVSSSALAVDSFAEESLLQSIQSLTTIIYEKVRNYEQTIAATKQTNAKLRKVLNQKLSEMQKRCDKVDIATSDMKKMVEAKIDVIDKHKKNCEEYMAEMKEKCDAKIIEMEQHHKDEMDNVVAETKKKTWCNHCWNEVTFKCTILPPACSVACLEELVKLEPNFWKDDDLMTGDSTDENSYHRNGLDFSKTHATEVKEEHRDIASV
ncbi:uncharacterized protein LOC116349439 isoform X2 [Contarinia nasturtii]|uniref:uncharacterized protein LOC116349439 isoform X2 n=1 Tax=Contarinia nasturtii TaxID=265458 RepID=UPI0012D3E39B|nr:uncharacterized protein LOC116349439 isoform X2 [Contarinia nasturtii]